MKNRVFVLEWALRLLLYFTLSINLAVAVGGVKMWEI